MKKYNIMIDDTCDGRKPREVEVQCDRIIISDDVIKFVVNNEKDDSDESHYAMVVSMDHFISSVESK